MFTYYLFRDSTIKSLFTHNLSICSWQYNIIIVYPLSVYVSVTVQYNYCLPIICLCVRDSTIQLLFTHYLFMYLWQYNKIIVYPLSVYVSVTVQYNYCLPIICLCICDSKIKSFFTHYLFMCPWQHNKSFDNLSSIHIWTGHYSTLLYCRVFQ